MKATYLHFVGAVSLTFALIACIPSAEPPAPSPAPVSAPQPAAVQGATPAPIPPPPRATPVAGPTPVSVVTEPVFDNYLDAPATPGMWRYEDEPGEKLALFGSDPRTPEFLLRCATGSLAIARVSSTPQSGVRSMQITAETGSKQFELTPVPGRGNILAASIDPNDPFLDAMAITKGRIAVGVEGMRTLYVPAWVEISRVIEDCR